MLRSLLMSTKDQKYSANTECIQYQPVSSISSSAPTANAVAKTSRAKKNDPNSISNLKAQKAVLNLKICELNRQLVIADISDNMRNKITETMEKLKAEEKVVHDKIKNDKDHKKKIKDANKQHTINTLLSDIESNVCIYICTFKLYIIIISTRTQCNSYKRLNQARRDSSLNRNQMLNFAIL